MTNMPTQIYICMLNKEPPAWVAERMTTGTIAADGSFDIDTPDGPTKVERGHAVFLVGTDAYACAPRFMADKVKEIAGTTEPAVQEMEARVAVRSHHAKPDREEQPLKLKPQVGAPCAPQFQPLSVLQVDDTYQRSIEGGASRTLIRRMAENWDWRLCLPLLVSRRQGELYVIDGQHRWEAARMRGDIHSLPVVVFDFDDPKAEAELFVAANRSRRPMSPLDDFHAAVVAGDPKATEINEVAAAAGLAIGRMKAWQYWKPGEIVFTTQIKNALHSNGRDATVSALTMIARAFEGQVLVGVGPLFQALAHFIHHRANNGPPVDIGLMQRIITETGIAGWRDAVKDAGRETVAVMGRALVEAYTQAEGE